MKKTLLLLAMLATASVYATMIDAIALIVEGEPITTSEILSVQKRGHLSKQQAIDLLVQDRLQKVAMKDISIPEERVDKEISRIAEQNGLSVKKMQQLLQKQGTSWSKYRESIRNSLKKRDFFKTKVAANLPTPTEEELKLFYENHKKEFKIPSTISVTEYSAPTKQNIQAFQKTQSTKGIKSKRINKKTKGMNPSMLGMFLQTPNGSFTTPINAGSKWVIYKVHSKSGSVQMPFENARGAVGARWRQMQQGEAIKDYFKKMKTEANIQIIRK
jgi:parvulin-like peptidyl-prolyl isomerase